MLRPGSTILRRSGLRRGVPRIDRQNPLAVGLTGAYLPGLRSARVQDFSGVGVSPICGTSTAFINTFEGIALDTSAQGAGQGCNGIATAAQQPTQTASVFWRGILLGTPSSNEYLFGVEFGDGSATPFDAYDLVYLSSGSLQGSCNTAVGGSFAASWTPPTNTVIDAATTVDVVNTGDMIIYGNGIQQAVSSPGAGTITYGTNPQLQIGGTNNAGQSAANARHLVCYTWNRALSAADIISLHINPYQLFIFPQDEIFDFLGGKSLTLVTFDSLAPIENFSQIRVDSNSFVEFLGSARDDGLGPVENLGSVRNDGNVPVEIIASIRDDGRGPIEFLGSARNDGDALIEFLGSARNDGDAPLEITARVSVTLDGICPVEFLGSTQVDFRAHVEFVGSVHYDGSSPLEETSSFRQDGGSPNEFLSHIQIDADSPDEILGSAQYDSSAPIDWSARISVTLSGHSPLEFTAIIRNDGSSPVDWTTLTRFDSSTALEFLKGIVIDAPAPLEILFRLSAPGIAPIEFSQAFSFDGVAPLETLIRQLNATIIARALRRQLIVYAEPRPLTILARRRNLILPFEGRPMNEALLLEPPIVAGVEEETVGFDFGPALQSGVQILASPAPQVTVTVASESSTQDPNPGSRIIGGPTIVPSQYNKATAAQVNILFGNAVGDVTYLLLCVATTSDGQKLVDYRRWYCVDPS